MEQLYPVEKAAEMLGGVSKWTIYQWMRQGRLKVTKVGSRNMFTERQLEDFVKRSNEPTEV